MKRLAITASMVFNASDDEVEFLSSDDGEADAFEALTMAHSMGVDPQQDNPLDIVIDFKVEEINASALRLKLQEHLDRLINDLGYAAPELWADKVHQHFTNMAHEIEDALPKADAEEDDG